MPRLDDDDIDVVEGLSVEQDDARYRPASGGQTKAQKPNKPAGAVYQKPGKPKVLLLVFCLLGLAVVSGWLGLQSDRLQKQLVQTQISLELARKRIDQLGNEVFSTGADFTETGNVIDEKFKFFDSEIRKLWDLSNKRNRPAITKNSAQIKSMAASVKKAAGQAQSSQQKLKAIEARQSELVSNFKKLNNQLLTENTTLRAALEDQSEQLLLVRSEMGILQGRLKNIPGDIAQRVKNNEEAVEAIDATRRQLISRITKLQGRLDQLQTGP